MKVVAVTCQVAIFEAIARFSGVTPSIELVGRPGKPNGDLAAISRADLVLLDTRPECGDHVKLIDLLPPGIFIVLIGTNEVGAWPSSDRRILACLPPGFDILQFLTAIRKGKYQFMRRLRLKG